jgi:hypothetical protein
MTTLYIDMDGVVADFDEFARRVLNLPQSEPAAGIYPNDKWQKLSVHQRMYRDLKKTPYADELVRKCVRICLVKDYEYAFLTAVPKANDVKLAFYDKVEWAQKYFPGIPVFFGPYSKDKHQHCQPGDILIDDRQSNIEEWTAAGGIAIHHTSIETTLAELSKL